MKLRMISMLLLASTLLASCGGTGSGTESTADAPGETSGTTGTERKSWRAASRRSITAGKR